MDALIYQTPDGGEINIDAEGVETTDGLESAAYLSLASGPAWWGDSIQPDEASKYPCAFIGLIEGIPATPGNLRRLESAAKTDLAAIPADSIVVAASVTGAKRVHIDINIDESHTEYTENWESMKPKFQSEFVPKPEQDGVEIGGRFYNTVEIGNLEWMAENLAYEKGAYLWPSNDSTNVEDFGLLYPFANALTLVPEGWRLPTQTDYETLTALGGGVGSAGAELKANDENQWPDDAERGLDPFGFSAQSGGRVYGLDNDNAIVDEEIRVSGIYWTNTFSHESGGLNRYRTMHLKDYLDSFIPTNEIVDYDNENQRNFSVRYVRDI